jgi:para-nitrobenzyl esterase
MKDSDKTVIETKSGKIKGSYQEGLYIFKGIPYAAPPVGELRWRPPQPVKPWQEVRQAQAFAPVAPQSGALVLSPEFHAEEPQSEDCLYLNIWSPGPNNSRRPVLVWIHGGAFNRGSGSSPLYAGTTLARRGNIIVVTFNYRLGPLGFLHLKKATAGRIPATGNEGLLDQVAALRWVRDNITAFGGDPDNVTVFGESAGGMSIGCLLAMPQARGLFHRAILQSGSNTVKSLDESAELTEQLLAILGGEAGDAGTLGSIPVARLLFAQQELSNRLNIKGSILEPVVDGETLPELPIDAVKHGSARGVAVIAGSNLEEAKFMARMDRGLTQVDDAGLLRRWQKVLPPDLVPGLIEACRKALMKEGLPAAAPDIALALQTQRQFRIPAIRLVEAHHSQGQPAYTYLFTWKSPAPGMGACHAVDIGFVFGNLSASFCGSGPAAEKLAKTMQDAWLAFARTGDPSCESLGNWPQYGSRRETMMLGEECHVTEAPYDDERHAWDKIPNIYLG